MTKRYLSESVEKYIPQTLSFDCGDGNIKVLFIYFSVKDNLDFKHITLIAPGKYACNFEI